MADFRDTTALHEAGWKSHAASGFRWEDPTNPEKRRLAIDYLKELGPGTSVRLLDFGCGDGSLSEFFHSLGYQVHGIDISETLIRRNRECFPHLSFQMVSPDKPTPYPDASFDAIFCLR